MVGTPVDLSQTRENEEKESLPLKKRSFNRCVLFFTARHFFATRNFFRESWRTCFCWAVLVLA